MNYFYRYLPLSDDVRRATMYVIACGYTLIPPHSTYPPFPHPDDHHFQWNRGRILLEHQIIYIAKGEGVFESQSAGRRRVASGSLFALFPGEWHRYSPDSASGWDEYWVAFGGINAEACVKEYSLSRTSPMIHANVSAAIKEEFLRVADEVRAEQIGYQNIAVNRTAVILSLAFALSQRRGFESSELLPLIEQAKAYLSERLDQNVNLEDLASSLNIGYSLFRKVFRAYTGFSPGQYHLELRINHAMNLLTMTTLPLAVIGDRVGMDPPGYFSRLFKKKTGYSPREFRMLSQNNSGDE